MTRIAPVVIALSSLLIACGDSGSTGSPLADAGADVAVAQDVGGTADGVGSVDGASPPEVGEDVTPAAADGVDSGSAPDIVDASPGPDVADVLAAPDGAAEVDAPGAADVAGADDVDAPEPSNPGAVQLLDPLDEPEHYCLDVPGSGDTVELESPLLAYTCKDGTPEDQTFVSNDPGPGQLRMPAYDLCLQSQGAWPTAAVHLAPCSDSGLQLFRLRDDQRIEMAVPDPGLCIAAAPGDGEPADGPSQLQRDLGLQPCDTVPEALSQWSVPGGVLAPVDPLSVCEDLSSQLDALIASHAGCTGPGQCQHFEYPICGSIGCYQRAVADSATLPDEVWALATDAAALQCEPFHCGCDFKGFPACIDDTCQLCPGPGCELDCEALLALLVAEVQARSACTAATDCAAVQTPLCTVPGLGCYQAAVNLSGTWGLVPALVQMVVDQGCAVADCDCQDQGTDCVEGGCVSVP